MLQKFKSSVSVKVAQLKTLIADNKLQFYALLIAATLGIIWAFGRAISDTSESANIYVLLTSGSYSIFTYLLRLALLFGLFYGILFIGSLQFYINFLSYLILAVVIYAFSEGYILSVLIDGFAGITIFICYFLPIFIFVLLAYFVAAARISAVASPCKRSQFINFSFYKWKIVRIITESAIPALVFISIMSIIVVIISLL